MNWQIIVYRMKHGRPLSLICGSTSGYTFADSETTGPERGKMLEAYSGNAFILC